MRKKHYPNTKELRDMALVMRHFAEICEEAASSMDKNSTNTLEIDNWETATRGLEYVNRAVQAISGAFMLGKANPVVRELLHVYKSQKVAADAVEEKRSSPQDKKR